MTRLKSVFAWRIFAIINKIVERSLMSNDEKQIPSIRKFYKLTSRTTPLPSQVSPEKQGITSPLSSNLANASISEFLRAEAEDDDGYDPYSDRPVPTDPLFEANPWD